MSKYDNEIAGYRIMSILGHGAGSTIYAAENPDDGQIYALKRVVRRTPNDQRFIDQAIVEHEVASDLEHDYLRKSFQIIRRRRLLRVSEIVVLLEFVDGQSLEQQCPKSLSQLVRTFRQVAEAIGAMHGQGYIHADLKPMNIIVESEDSVKVIDFGQACVSGTIKPRVQGTPDYIAPEQVLKQAITPQTDVFNFGATLYWCATAQHVPTLVPRGNPANSLGEIMPPKIRPASELNEKINTALNTLIMQCLAFDPNDRPATMEDLAVRLDVIDKQLTKASVASVSE